MYSSDVKKSCARRNREAISELELSDKSFLIRLSKFSRILSVKANRPFSVSEVTRNEIQKLE